VARILGVDIDQVSPQAKTGRAGEQ